MTLPANWAFVSFGDVIQTTSGGTPSRNKKEFYEGSIAWVKSGELKDGLINGTSETISDEAIKASSAKVFPAGTLLIALYGATIGKLGILKIDAATNQAVCALFLPHFLDTKYVFYLLMSLRETLVSKAQGGAQPNISQNIVRATKMPMPPLNEQKRIVEKLEQLLSELDKAVDALKTAQEKLKTYRRAVLKAAVEGELSSVWREKNKERLEPAVNDSLKPNVLDVGENTTGLPQLPDKWVWMQLSQVSDALGGFAFKSSDYTDEGFQIVKIGNVGKESLKLSVKPSFINEVDNKIVEKYSLKTNDVVISLTGTRFKRDYGHPIMIESHGKLLLNQRVARLRFHKKLDPKYCQIALASEQFQNQFFSYETGNVGQGNVGMNALRETYIALPPFEEQVVIRDAVDAHNSVTENLQNILTQALQKSQRLRQAILQKAFSGLLVPQDPNDEPASVLLERIRAEREAAGADKGKRGKKKTADELQPRLLEVDA